jgi:DNA repair photolyase
MGDCDLQHRAFGPKRWADQDKNIAVGCANNCRYCMAKATAMQFKRISGDEWPEPRIRPNRKRLRPRGTPLPQSVMFPSTHDINLEILPECLDFIGELLNRYAKVLLASKPRLECIRAICERYEQHKDRILFRFTITSCDPETLKFWEPGAPDLAERLECLKLAQARGFGTSVSCEPMLDEDMRPLIKMVRPFVTETIVLGRINMPKQQRGADGKFPPEVEARLERLQEAHSSERLRALYEDAFRIFHAPPSP